MFVENRILNKSAVAQRRDDDVRFAPDSVAKLLLSLGIDRDSFVMRQSTMEAGDDGSAGAVHSIITGHRPRLAYLISVSGNPAADR